MINWPKQRSWGWYATLIRTPWFCVKLLRFAPYSKLSLQRHLHRNEIWFFLKGVGFVNEPLLGWKKRFSVWKIDCKTWHQFGTNILPVYALELQYGKKVSESDIERNIPGQKMIKRATLNEAELINSWRNDPETLRLLSLRKQPFTTEETSKWMGDILQDDYQALFWIKDKLLIREIAQEKGDLLTIYFNPKQRMVAVRECLKFLQPIKRPLLAETKVENRVMRKILLKVGFIETGSSSKKGCDLIQYRKN